MNSLEKIKKFRKQTYQKSGNARDALFDLMDAVLTTRQISSFVELSLSPVFRREWSSIYDQEGARQVFQGLSEKQQQFQRLVRIWADGTYRSEAFMCWVMDSFRWVLEVVLRSDRVKGFVVQPKRWVVERTFGLLHWYRRLSKDYERLTKTSETMIYVAMIRIMLR